MLDGPGSLLLRGPIPSSSSFDDRRPPAAAAVASLKSDNGQRRKERTIQDQVGRRNEHPSNTTTVYPRNHSFFSLLFCASLSLCPWKRVSHACMLCDGMSRNSCVDMRTNDRCSKRRKKPYAARARAAIKVAYSETERGSGDDVPGQKVLPGAE